MATENLDNLANLAALPPDRIYEQVAFGEPASHYARVWLVMSLAQLGRFAEAAAYAAEVPRLAEPTHDANTGLAHVPAATLHLLKGDWAKARSLIEHGIAVLRMGENVTNLGGLASSSWVLAQHGESGEALDRLREAEAGQ